MGRITLDTVDHLAIDVFNEVSGLVVNVTARVLTPDGRINEHRLTVRPTSDRAENNASLPLSAGELVSVSVHPTGATVRRGQAFVYAFLSRDSVDRTFPNTVLISGYLESGSGLGSPGSRFDAMADGPGACFENAISDPAAGAEFSYTVPAGMRLALYAVRWTLATSVGIANRRCRLLLDNGTTVLAEVPAGSTQSSSKTVNYYAFSGNEDNIQVTDPIGLLLPSLLFTGGDRIRSSVDNIDTDDQLSSVVLVGQTWLAA